MSYFNHIPEKPKSELLKNSYNLLVNTHNVCNDFLKLYDMIKVQKITEEITIADNILDLYRSALLFASSGLDSLVKQLVRDSLADVIRINIGAEERFRVYVEKKITRNDNQSFKSISRALVSQDPRNHFLDELIYEITDKSLQSNDELLNAASYFDISSSTLVKDFVKLKNAFVIRNQIAHEMDFNYKTNSRRIRKTDELFNSTDYIFEISNRFIFEVDNKLIEKV